MLYFISILASGTIAGEVNTGKQYMLKHFGCKVALKSPPHITLVPPVELSDPEAQRLIGLLDQFRPGIAPFYVGVKDYQHFEQTVIYLHVIPNDLLTTLNRKLQMYLRNAGFSIDSRPLPFVPHITVATRDIPPAQFATAFHHFSRRRYTGSMIARRITLLRLDPGQWQIEKEFNLS